MGQGRAPIDELLDRVPRLAGGPRTVEELPGGLTNHNYKVTTPGGSFVARTWAGGGGDLLAINRDHEYVNSVIAARAGVGAPVIEYRPADCLLVIGYINGRTYGNSDVADPANIPRIAAACRRLHAAQRFGNDFDMFEIQPRYRSVIRSRGLRLPAAYDDFAAQFGAARAALAARDVGTVPCNNAPCFELGNIAAESGLSPEGLAELVIAYYGRARRSRIARARLFGLVARYGWTLWGAIQSATSPLDFDFGSWAMEKYEAASADFTGPGFARLLDDVQQGD